MKILVIGSGGREHAIIWKLSQSKNVEKIFCVPGNAGICGIAQCEKIDILDFKKITDFVKQNKIDLTIVGPELPLSEGIVDYFKVLNLPIFGPTKLAAQLESSKVFAKNFMKEYGIPTAGFEVFGNSREALDYITSDKCPTASVVKADGLAAGKGVFVCNTKEDARIAVKKIMVDKVFGTAGDKIIIEEKLKGEELSMIAFCDGQTVLPLISTQDHKTVFDGDRGPNTGGMGAYAPAKIFDENVLKEKVFDNFLKGIENECMDFRGIIYAGIMVTEKGPRVLEFNVRFGDPETQAILPLLKSDLADLMTATVNGRLDKCKMEWETGYCVCVVLTSGGYPGEYEAGKEISGLGNVKDATVFHAATTLKEKKYFTNGGRVLNVCAVDDSLQKTISKVYKNVEKIQFEKMHFRWDIAAKGR